MLTTFATPLTIGLLAVTFGWTPAEPAAGKGEADSYEYHLRLSDADLAALRSGRIDSLSSELPRDLRSIERVRITLGGEAPPRQYTRSDQQSPRRLAEAGTAEKRVVAKPVIPEWGPMTAKQRTAYQNPNVFDPRTVADGLQRGFERAGDLVQDGAQNLVGGTRDALEQGRDNLRNGTQNLLNGTANVLEGRLPTDSGQGAFGSRPRFDPNGYTDQRAAPPAPTNLPGQNYNQAPTAAPAFRDPGQPAGAPAYDDRNFVRADQNWERSQADQPRDNGLAESFTDRGRASEVGQDGFRSLTPIERARPFDRRSPDPRFDSFADERGYDQNPRGGYERDRSYESGRRGDSRLTEVGRDDWGRPTGPSFPALPSEAPRQEPRQYVGFDRQPLPASPTVTPTAAVGVVGGGSAPPVRDEAVRPWNPGGDAAAPPKLPGQANEVSNTPAYNPDWGDRLMLIFLAGLTCFTGISYFNLRTKYLMALRGLPPTGGYHPSA